MPSVERHEPRNNAVDSSRYASTPHDAHARTPNPDASTLDARPPFRPLHPQIEGENRSRSAAAEQVCERWTLTAYVIKNQKFPVPRKKFPVCSN